MSAELEEVHLASWAKNYPSDQTQRTYITFCKAVMDWAVKKETQRRPKSICRGEGSEGHIRGRS